MAGYKGLEPRLTDNFTQFFTGDGTTANYTLTYSVPSVYAVMVLVSGLYQRPGIDYTVSGTLLTISPAPPVTVSNGIAVVFLGKVGSTIIPGAGTVAETALSFNTYSEGYGFTRGAITFSGSITPNFTTNQFFDMSGLVTSSFTINFPTLPAGTTAGLWAIDCTVDGTGGRNMGVGTGLNIVNGYEFVGDANVKNRIWFYIKSASTADIYVEQV